jgi:sialic acid synthase SpsE
LALRPSAADLQERRRWFRHIVAAQDIPRGTLLTPAMLACKRPEKGISPEFLECFLGRATSRDLKYIEALIWQDVI